MRLKPVPAPADPGVLRAVHASLPRVPKPERDCCARVAARTDVAEADAPDWLVFARALALAREVDGKYVRVPDAPTDTAALAAAFREGVYAAREVLDALADAPTPLTAGAVFEGVAGDVVPRWERERDPDWAATWRERVRRLLEWAVAFALAARTDDGYILAEA